MKATIITCSVLFGATFGKNSIFNTAKNLLDKDPFKENAELDALDDIIDDLDEEWDDWMENRTEQEKQDDPWG